MSNSNPPGVFPATLDTVVLAVKKLGGNPTVNEVATEVEMHSKTVVRAWRAEDLNNFRHSGWGALQAVADFSSHLGDSARVSSNPDTIIKNLLERTQQQPLLAQARDLVLALN